MNPRSTGLRVLESFGSGGARTNPYLIQLARELEHHVVVIPFSWKAALFGTFDVFHVHWPELLVRGSNRVKTQGRRLLTSLLLARIRFSRIAIVRTLHNPVAHEAGGGAERRLLGRLDSLTDAVIQLNPATPNPLAAPSHVVLHGHYREWFSGISIPSSEPGRILFFGLIRRYKGVEQLLDAFAGMPDATASLRVAGRPDSPEVESAVVGLAQRDRRVTLQLEYLPDERLAEEIGRAEVVVLPYTSMQNSGAALLALSLDRPILVPEVASMRALRDEVGHEWIHLFRGTIDAPQLADGIAAARRPRMTTQPDLSARAWPAIGAEHAEVFTEAHVSARNHRSHRNGRPALATSGGDR